MTNQIECIYQCSTNVIVFPDIDDRGGALSVTASTVFLVEVYRRALFHGVFLNKSKHFLTLIFH